MSEDDDPAPPDIVLSLDDAFHVLVTLEDALLAMEEAATAPGLQDELATVIRMLHGRLAWTKEARCEQIRDYATGRSGAPLGCPNSSDYPSDVREKTSAGAPRRRDPWSADGRSGRLPSFNKLIPRHNMYVPIAIGQQADK
jgi:hypothetical protein